MPKAYLPYKMPHRRRVQRMIYITLLAFTIGVLLPWSLIMSPVGGLVVAFLLMTGLVGWLHFRMLRMHVRMNRLEFRLQRLASQKTIAPSKAQSVSHLEAERYFSPDQTRH